MARPPRIEGTTRKGVFAKEAFDAIRRVVSPKVGHDKAAVQVVARHFQTRGVSDLFIGVTAEMVERDAEAIVASAEVRPPQEDGAREERVNFREWLSDEAEVRFAGGEWKNRLGLRKTEEYLAKKGLLMKGGVTSSMLDEAASYFKVRSEKITELLGEGVDPDAPQFSCERPQHRGQRTPTAPTRRYAILWRDGEPAGRKQHAHGDGYIMNGDLLFQETAASEIISKSSLEELEKADVMELCRPAYRAYCPDCRREAIDEAKGILDFRTYASLRAKLEGMRNGRIAPAKDSYLEGGAERRPPRTPRKGQNQKLGKFPR